MKDYYCEGKKCPVKKVCKYYYTKNAGITIEKCTNQKLFERNE